MTTNLVFTIDRKIEQNLLYWSIVETLRDLGFIVNSSQCLRHINTSIKDIKDILWPKVIWGVSLLKLRSEKSLVLIKVNSIVLSDIKIVVSLRYEDE